MSEEILNDNELGKVFGGLIDAFVKRHGQELKAARQRIPDLVVLTEVTSPKTSSFTTQLVSYQEMRSLETDLKNESVGFYNQLHHIIQQGSTPFVVMYNDRSFVFEIRPIQHSEGSASHALN